MNKTISILVAMCMAFALVAQDIKTVSTKISDVTVFLSGAQVVHEGSVSLKAGENTLKIENLTTNLDPNSVQVEGNPNYTILSVRHQINYLMAQQPTTEIKAVMDSLEETQFSLKERQTMRMVYSEEKQMILANRSIKGNDGILLPEDLAEMADFFRSRLKEVEYKILELNQEEKELNEEITRLQNQLNNLNARRGQNPSEVIILVDADKATTTNLKVSYTTWSAGWYPVYDLRSEEINAPIELIYKAKVFQSTGNDWKNVDLTISTGNPSAGGQSPEMYPWYLYIYDPKPIYRRDEDNVYEGAPPAAADKSKDEEMSSELYNEQNMDTKSLAEYNTVQANAVNVEFKIGIPFDVPSDNQHYDVELQRSNLKANYEYIVAPKLDNDAFLRAQLTDWAQYNLLPGESNIYFSGTYVGKGYIDPALANDTLNLSLGRDKGIQVKREMLKDFSKTGNFGGKNQTTKAYEITVTNNKKVAVPVTIEDQFPISQNADIEVEREETSGGVVDDATGKITWKQIIQPGETVKKQIRFNVKYPKKKLVSGL
ncbi:MAG: mucoidy inhibitor MuiA family protein [Flavobacteriales bacterium]|nr:mucoidy inhibitor MuiA family protein [Flavobacteriales bacterium]